VEAEEEATAMEAVAAEADMAEEVEAMAAVVAIVEEVVVAMEEEEVVEATKEEVAVEEEVVATKEEEAEAIKAAVEEVAEATKAAAVEEVAAVVEEIPVRFSILPISCLLFRPLRRPKLAFATSWTLISLSDFRILILTPSLSRTHHWSIGFQRCDGHVQPKVHVVQNGSRF